MIAEQKFLVRFIASIQFAALLLIGTYCLGCLAVAHGYETGIADVLRFGNVLFVIAVFEVYLVAAIASGQLPQLTISIRMLMLVTGAYAVWLWIIT